MKEIRYDGKRRVKRPCLGSVKLGCTLPRGICYEANIREGKRPVVHLPEALETS